MQKLLKFLKEAPIKGLYTILVLVGLFTIASIVFSPYIPKNVTIQVGESSNGTITSPRYLEFETQQDRAKTAKLRQQRRELVEPIYSVDENINKAITSKIVSLFTSIKEFKTSESKENIPESLRAVNKKQLTQLIAYDDSKLASIEYLSIQNVEKLLSQGIQEANPKTIKQQLLQNLKILNLSNEEISVIFRVINASIQPNLVLNEGETNSRIQSEMNAIKPFKTIFKEGQPIIYKGDILTEFHVEVLKALNMYGTKANLLKFLGILIFTALLFLLLDRFVYYFNHHLYQNVKYFFLTFFVFFMIIGISRLLLNLELPQLIDTRFLIPISIASMLLSLLVTPNISLLCGAIIALLISVMYQADFLLFIYLFLSNATATFSTYKRTKRTELINAGYTIGLFNIIFVLVVGIFQDGASLLWFGSNFLIAFLNGVVSAMVSLAIMPYLESLFAITTQQRLLELGNLNHPLLKKLMMTAPGTYQHSLMVATLAEAAAEAIGADPVTCRVGSYFHDIGKMKRPLFFIENQLGEENPHNTLSPRMSKIIIASHTKDGVEMAKNYNMPKVLQDIMIQHHGTALVSFFYTQALQLENIEDSESAKDEFRYSGPKPQFVESGIVMLADTIEAAVRSMKKPTLPKIENLINKLVNDKITDGQLNECPLSLKNLEEIRETFLTVFSGMYHTRIDYQDELMKNTPPKVEETPAEDSD